MNLQSLVSGVISTVNPPTFCTIRISTGSTTNAAGARTPQFTPYPNVSCQIQPLSTSDLKQVDALNLQGIHRAVWINGDSQAINRAAIKGGDLLVTPDGVTWKVTMVPEHWTDWTHMIVTQQNGSV